MFEHFFVKWRLWSQPDCARWEALPTPPSLQCPGSWPVSWGARWTAPPWPPCTARATPPGSSSTGPSRWGRLGTPCTPGHRGSEAAYPGPLREIPRGPEVTSSPPALLAQADGAPGEGALLLAGAGGGGGGGDREDAQEGGSSACNSSFGGIYSKQLYLNWISFRCRRVWSSGPTPHGRTTRRPSWCSWRPGRTTWPWRRWTG